MSADQEQQPPAPHVCVIGAGVCGLVAVKICLENGLRVSCFDKSSKYGGLWNYRPDEESGDDPNAPFEPSVMRTTILNTSKELSSFSDFPPPAKLPNFMRHNHYMDYIHSYVEKFHLAQHLNLQHEILKCSPEWNESTRQVTWLVQVKNLKSSKEEELKTLRFDRLMVAVGHHNIPYAPTYEGQHLFKGEIIHSARLKDILSNKKLADKRVLVIGFGNSACDAANDIAIVAKKCYVSCHRGQWFTSRYLHSGPYDFALKNRMFYYADKLAPTRLIDRAIVGQVEKRVNHELLGLRPKHSPSEGVPAINDLFPYRIYTGGIVLKSSIRTFTENGVKFEGEEEDDDEEEHLIDVVVLATGYEAKISFLDELQLGIRSMEHNNEYDLFMNIFAPKLTLPLEGTTRSQQEHLKETNNNNNNNNNINESHSILEEKKKNREKLLEPPAPRGRRSTPQEVINSLAFIGLVQPNGSITVVSELQARYASLVFSGQLELPKQKTMLSHMERVRRERSRAIRSHSRDQLIGNYVAYLEDIAALIGVRPNLTKLFFKDYALWKALAFGPCVPYQYRLSGPGHWPGARETILTTARRVYQGINEGKNHILYKTRRKCLTESSKDKGKSKAAAAAAAKTKQNNKK